MIAILSPCRHSFMLLYSSKEEQNKKKEQNKINKVILLNIKIVKWLGMNLTMNLKTFIY